MAFFKVQYHENDVDYIQLNCLFTSIEQARPYMLKMPSHCVRATIISNDDGSVCETYTRKS
jgi:hypothetical protein